MQRTLIASLMLGLALTSLGCANLRYDDQDRTDYKDYFWRHLRDHNMNGAGGRLNLNSASTRELDNLPGLSCDDAEKILAGRPYGSTHELVDRRIIEPRQYDIIEHWVYACPTCPESYAYPCPCGAAVVREPAPVIERRG